VYTLQPKSGGQAASHATQCSWALQKLKSGAPAGVGTGQTGRPTDTDPLSSFIDGFITRIGQDGTLSSQWQKVKQGFQNMGHAASARDFITQGLAELLQVLALLLDGALAVSNAFLDGFLDLLDSLISTLFDPSTGWLTRPLDIPVLSWLYQKLFGQPLTVLNVITLVAAIPVTVVWRVVEGEWPSQSLASLSATQVGVPRVVATIMAIFSGVMRIVTGCIAALQDFQAGKGTAPIYGRLRVYCGLSFSLSNFPLLRSTGAPTDLAWAGLAVATGAAMVGTVGLVQFAEPNPLLGYIVSGLMFVLGLAMAAVAIVAFVKDSKHRPVDDLNLAAGLTVAFFFIINPVKFVEGYGSLFVALMDIFLGVAAAALAFAAAAEAA
jgi:hypothetical protein